MNLLPALPLAISCSIQIANSCSSFLLGLKTKGSLREIESMPLPKQAGSKLTVGEGATFKDLQAIGQSPDGKIVSNDPEYVSRVVSRDKDAAAALFGTVAVAVSLIFALLKIDLVTSPLAAAIAIAALAIGGVASWRIARADPMEYGSKRIMKVFSRYAFWLACFYFAAGVFIFLLSPNPTP